MNYRLLQAKFLIASAVAGLLAFQQPLFAQFPGLPTRDQTPLLQAYFIPATIDDSGQRWSFSQSLYITNTYQIDRNSHENLVIDVENTRLDLQANYAQGDWRFNINVPLIQNRSGFLDSTIIGWHDFFGLPQGGRDQAANNQLQLQYQQGGETLVDINQASSAVGDIQLAAGYALNNASQWWLGIEQSVSNDALISNQHTDVALWFQTRGQASSTFTPYGMLGLAWPGSGGAFDKRVKNQFVFGQLGTLYAWRADYQWLLQADYHSGMVQQTRLDALTDSLQAQFGLRLPHIFDGHQMDIFFSEDIYPGHAPDITFGLRFSTAVSAH